MIIHDRSFPHPVLSPFRDDVMPNAFEINVVVSSDADNYYLDVTLTYDNPTLARLIEEGKAVHSVHIECKRNYYRELVSFKNRSARLAIRASEIVGRVEVSGFIKAENAIDSYSVEGAHADYGTTTFQVNPGDILAVAISKGFDAYVDYDPLKRISSILTIRRSEDLDEGAMLLDTTGDRIVATLSQKDYDRYRDLKGDPNLGPLLANQVVFPALLEAVHEIQDVPDDELEIEMRKRWFRSIQKKLEDLGVMIRATEVTAIDAVQRILNLPLRRSLEGLIQNIPLDTAEGEGAAS